MRQRSPLLLLSSLFLLMALVVALFCPNLSAQTTLSTGSIQGTITDQSGAVLSAARVTITNKATGQMRTATSSSSGLYTSGSLAPGEYLVKVETKGFKSAELPVTVQVGVTANGNMKLTVGQSTETVEVQASAVSINTEQATVQGVLTSQQIENLPTNGRNFLDLAQLEPGVQIQEGSTFDPTKNGFSSISFEGRFGRTARIEVDGVDISDETVGTTTQNVPASAIQEFQISQSSLDLSTELTSSGAVNVTTRSGSNQLHGQAFGSFRGNQTAADLPGNVPPPFQRTQFGGRAGGSFIKDKLFWFVDAERSKQDLTAAQPFIAPFDTLNTTLVEPFRETQVDGRLDWQIRGSARFFYRFNFDENSQIRPFGSSSSLQGFKNFNHTPSHTAGLDFNTGSYTHSIRFSLLEFRNSIVDGTGAIPAGINNPVPGLGINIGAPVVGSCVLSGGGAYCGGPNLLAPQATPQSNRQVKYDGSKVIRNHIFRYGVAFNHIQGGGFAGFFAFPQVGTTSAGASNDPTSYPIQFAFLGNGVGFSTNQPAFGYPGGGLGPDNRLETYLGDGWKIRHNLTLTYGLHYVHDTGRVDSNLGPLPALNLWGPGLGDQVRTPGNNFAPQLGFAWNVGGSGKTVVRGGGGLFFENSIWNNVYFDSPARIPQGTFAATPLVCVGGPNVGPGFPWPSDPGALGTPIAGGAGVSNGDGTVSATFCNQTIASAGNQVIALSNAFKAAAAANPPTPQPNPNFVGTALNAANVNGFDLFDPNYRTPRSWQMNIGFQHEFRPGMVFSADYVRNIGEHFLLVVDKNHSGAARSFNLSNAVAARDAAQTGSGCAPGLGQATCMIINNGGQAGAQAAYSAAGLDSNVATTGGAPCSFCAFPGTNPVSGNAGAVGTLDMLSPVGRSVYDGLQLKLVQSIKSPMRGMKSANFQVSYALSKFVSQVTDQDFVTLATNNDDPTQFTGPNALDRRHQLSFGGTFDLPFLTRISIIGHFYSALPQNLFLPQLTSGGEIFATDWLGSGLGSGSSGEPVPGTQIGQFERGTNAGNLQALINNYNSRYAGTLTPAGNQLVNNGVLSSADMSLLGWVMPQLPSVPAGARDFGWLKGFDFKAAWPIRIKERFTVEPGVSIFNLFNFSNAFLGGNLPLQNLTPNPNNPGVLASNAVGGVTQQNILPFRATFQSGTYALGAPRQFEFGLKIDF
jgi:hypothetical protein